MSALATPDENTPFLYGPSEGRGPRTIVVHAGTLRRWLVGSAEYPAIVSDAGDGEGDGRWDEIDRYVERLPGDDNAPLSVLFLLSVFDDQLLDEIMSTLPERYPSVIKYGFHMQETMLLQSAFFQPWTLVVFVGDLAVTCVAFDDKGLAIRDTAKRIDGNFLDEENAEEIAIKRVSSIVQDALNVPGSDGTGEPAHPIHDVLVRLPTSLSGSLSAVQEGLNAALNTDAMKITVQSISPVQERLCDSAMSGAVLHWSLESHGVSIGSAGSDNEQLASIYSTPFNWAIGKHPETEVKCTSMERNLIMKEAPFAIPEGSDRYTLFIN